MKILHTSDWHIGHKLYGHERDEEFEIFAEKVLEIIKTENIELLLICGDIFDVAFPSNTSLAYYYKLLTSIVRTSCKYVVIVGGNHDSSSTLEAPKEILKYLNIKVIGNITDQLEDEIIVYENEKTAIFAVPFLRNKDIRETISGANSQERATMLRQGIRTHYEQLAEKAKELKTKGFCTIATGHLYVNGMQIADEREIHIGNLASFSREDFPDGFDYWALGHIHKPQMISDCEHIRYSGSPIPLSFSEKNDPKSVIVLETKEDKLVEIRKIAIPHPRRLMFCSGNMLEIRNNLMTQKLSDFGLRNWVELEISDIYSDIELMQQINKLKEELLNVEILKYQRIKTNELAPNSSVWEGKMLNEIKEIDIFERKISNLPEQEKEELLMTFKELQDLHYHTE